MLHTNQIGYYGALLLVAALAQPAAAQSKFSTVYAFNADPSAADGRLPIALVAGGTAAHPVLYGTTLQGGPLTQQCTSGCGTVFSLTPPSPAGDPWTETRIYNFTSPADGLGPNTLLLAPSGVLYGTTGAGGTDGYGTAFLLAPPSSSGAPWTKSTFQVTTNLEFWIPNNLVLVNGVLYGVSQGDASGTFFSLIPPNGAGQAWTFTLLLSLYPAFDPMVLTPGGNGVFYLTSNGTVIGKCGNCGVVLSLTTTQPSGAWTYTLLHGFGGAPSDGNGFSAVALGSGGVLYGVTNDGGTHGFGTVFSLTPPASPGAAWTEAILYNFAGGKDAAYPNPSVVLDANGVIYGTSSNGGDPGCPLYYASGCGTVFSLTPPASSGGAWTEKVLHAFHAGNDGAFPLAGVTLALDGTLYGATTQAGGEGKYGTVFKLQ
ncbi:MAG: choice-of-anchor tandem repeat GloVer-containing protein [Bryobacteraceae bacterium]